MENNTPSVARSSLLKPKKMLLLGGLFILLIAMGGIFVVSRLGEKKDPLTPIPQDALYAHDTLIVKVSEKVIPLDSNEKGQELFEKLKELGVTKYEKVFTTESLPLAQFYKLTLKKGVDVATIRSEVYALGGVESSEPDYILETQATANDPMLPSMWDMQKIKIETAWDISKGADTVNVAVVDTGIDYTHPDFVGRTIIRGKDFSTCDSSPQDLKNSGGQCTKPKPADDDPMDNMGHGTHVAGTIGAVANNGKGIPGINWNVSLTAVKVLGAGGAGGLAQISQGIQNAVDSGAKVINMSLGGKATCTAGSDIKAVIDYANSQGVTVIAAAGNDNIDASSFTPANCPGVITVGSTGSTDQRAYYSNFGSLVEIAAPGGDKGGQAGKCSQSNCITSTWLGGQYVALQGTSMASPHVAGVAALVIAQNPNFSPSDVLQCMVQSGDPITTDVPLSGKRLNAYNALNGCGGSNTSPTQPILTVSPTSSVPSPTASVTDGQYYIKGMLFKDDNKNLKKDTGESAYPGGDVLLQGTITRPLVTTGSTGEYSFLNLSQGDYILTTTVAGTQVMEYRFSLTTTEKSLAIDIPIPPQITSVPTPLVPTTPLDRGRGGRTGGGVTGTVTPSPTPRIFYSCRERTTTRNVDNKRVQIKYLDCTPRR